MTTTPKSKTNTTMGDSDGGGLFALLRPQTQTPDAAPDPAISETASGPVTRRRLPLSVLRLDISQPRRPLPLAYAKRVNDGALTLVEALRAWARATGVPLDLDADLPTDGAGLKDAWAELNELRTGLARSIRDSGLINDITVVDMGNGGFRIETGERRTLAHALLTAAGVDGHATVPARIVETGAKKLGRRQLDENDQRKDLSAIQRARVLWDVRYRISNLSLDWQRVDAAADSVGALLESPKRGELRDWADVAETLGMTRGRISQIIQVFQLPRAAIELAEAHGFSDRLLRPVIKLLEGRPALQIQLLEKAAAALAAGEGFSTERMADEIALALAAEQSPSSEKPRAPTQASLLTQSRKVFGAAGRLLGEKPGARGVQAIAQAVLTDPALVKQVLALRPLVEAVAAGAAPLAGESGAQKAGPTASTRHRKSVKKR